MEFSFHLFGVMSVSFDNLDEFARHLYRRGGYLKKARLLFFVTLDTAQKDYIICLFAKASVTSQRNVENPENGAVEWTKASASLQKQSTC